ncbi:uncharacterized protein LOC113463050 [Phoenix dactylifera]|uniref:Uncharacterized protein LOC113463050 n=1 Tax=Phoenix dactylifera TaxID=42345 RepID=A0A8B8J7E4_PHODC|nr:uncharacterized protein LOC113463050 [Phoenix dactylifera]
MSHHRTHSLGNMPFSWENQPGVSKVAPSTEERPKGAGPPHEPLKLPPPPFSTDSPKLAAHGLYVPLPPCPFQPTRVILSKKGMSRREQDPFLAAYLECTKSVNKQKKASKCKAGLQKARLVFSCKHTCGVREDGMVRLSQLPGIHLKGERVGRGEGRMGINSLKGRGY